MDSREILQKHIVVEGHRDVYEQLYRASVGEPSPVRDAIAPRLIRDGINLCVYAIAGDSYSHSQNTGRYLETALDQIDMFLQEETEDNDRNGPYNYGDQKITPCLPFILVGTARTLGEQHLKDIVAEVDERGQQRAPLAYSDEGSAGAPHPSPGS